MKRLLYPLAVLSICVFMGADSDSCSTDTTNTPDSSSDSPSANESSGEKKQVAHLGDSITLKGTDTRLKVTVLDLIDPLEAGSYDEPQSGNRFVGVKIALSNIGDTSYDDSPSNGATLVTNRDEQADSALIAGGRCNSNFGSSVKLGPGGRRVGCLPFEVQRGQRPKLFQFALDSGFGPQNGEWRLR